MSRRKQYAKYRKEGEILLLLSFLPKFMVRMSLDDFGDP